MANFYNSYDRFGRLTGAQTNFARSRYEINLSYYKNRVYVHVSDIRKCFDKGVFIEGNKKTITFNHDDAMELQELLAGVVRDQTQLMVDSHQKVGN